MQLSLPLNRTSLALLVALFVGCGVAPTEYDSCCETLDTCPTPGPGVLIGGFTGSGENALATPMRRLILMGGGAEDDEEDDESIENHDIYLNTDTTAAVVEKTTLENCTTNVSRVANALKMDS